MILVVSCIILVETGMILVVFERFFPLIPSFLAQKRSFVQIPASGNQLLTLVFSAIIRFLIP
jgi:hypothetical protein